ncbi:hypothetical protein GCM10010335_59340 [Streptomyces galbus]|nr:hypothetical protein GCM10010335_59340 [Streptomyces galbus]
MRFRVPGSGPVSGAPAGRRGRAGICGGGRGNGCFRLWVYRHPGPVRGRVGVRRGCGRRQAASTRQRCLFLAVGCGAGRGRRGLLPVARWPGGRVAGWPGGRVAGWPVAR